MFLIAEGTRDLINPRQDTITYLYVFVFPSQSGTFRVFRSVGPERPRPPRRSHSFEETQRSAALFVFRKYSEAKGRPPIAGRT